MFKVNNAEMEDVKRPLSGLTQSLAKLKAL